MPHRICFVTAEYAPLAKTGGLADVSAALTQYLHRHGHDVRVFLPLYRQIAERGLPLQAVAGLEDLVLRIGDREYGYTVRAAPAPGTDLPLHFVDCPELFGREAIYGSGEDEHVRFLLLTRVALESCQRLAFSPDVFHCNDWHTAFGPLLVRTLYAWDRLFAATRSVLTIHNIAYQGWFPASRAGDVGIGASNWLLHQDDLAAGVVNPMKHGVMYADLVTTVSPGYAREICTPEYGAGLEDYLRRRGDSLVGILNGVDYDYWNPASDPYLPRRFGPEDLANKGKLKRELARRLELELGPRTMLVGMVTRFVEQKGIDLLPEAVPPLLRERDWCLAVLGSGERRYEDWFAWLAAEFPRRVAYRRGYDEELAHWIEAASDAFLMPSRYEPCGLNQMYSLKYGTVPIVRRTGGLADSVEHWDPKTQTGTGIVFDHYDAPAVSWALGHALDLYRNTRAWRKLRLNGMAQDFSWERQGALYVAEYDRLTGTGSVEASTTSSG